MRKTRVAMSKRESAIVATALALLEASETGVVSVLDVISETYEEPAEVDAALQRLAAARDDVEFVTSRNRYGFVRLLRLET